jgi:hypothetical protein
VTGSFSAFTHNQKEENYKVARLQPTPMNYHTYTNSITDTAREGEREKKHRSKVGFRSSCYVRVVVGSSTAHVTEYVMEGCSRLPLIIPLITAFCWEPRHYNLTVAHKGKAGT